MYLAVSLFVLVKLSLCAIYFSHKGLQIKVLLLTLSVFWSIWAMTYIDNILSKYLENSEIELNLVEKTHNIW
jgi:hypothetical protein